MKLASLILPGLLLFAACGVGDDGGDDDGVGTDVRLCTAAFSLTGTYSVGSAPPDRQNNETGEPGPDGMPDIQGCWPTGTWSFQMTPTESDCSPAPTPPVTVAFRVDFIDDAVEPAYRYTLTQPTSGIDKTKISVSQGGGGKCEGIIELFVAEGTDVYNLTPNMNVFATNGPITGLGEFSRWNRDQRPDF